MRAFVLLALLLLPGSLRADPRWPEWRAIIWSDQKAAGYQALKAAGIDAAKVLGIRTSPIDPAAVAASTAEVKAAGIGYYVENLATDFYSPYHRWTPEHPNDVTWLMGEVRKRFFANPADPGTWERTPSLSDEAWLDRVRTRLGETVKLHAPSRPLFYNLADEPGIADLTAASDFDLSPPALAAFRAWLRLQYGTLAAVNAQWGTSFPTWDAVRPETTSQAFQRKDNNWSSW